MKDQRDILEVLRDPGYIGQQAIFARAADEIEQLRKALYKIAQQDYDAGYDAETFAEAVLSNWPGILDDDEQKSDAK